MCLGIAQLIQEIFSFTIKERVARKEHSEIRGDVRVAPAVAALIREPSALSPQKRPSRLDTQRQACRRAPAKTLKFEGFGCRYRGIYWRHR